MKSSIAREIDDKSVANEVRMTRAADKNKAILIVEGSSDARLFNKLFDDSKCAFVVSLGKERALISVSALNEKESSGVLCILDKDFSDHLEPDQEVDNILLTDENDIELMIICSGAFGNLVDEFGSLNKITELENEERRTLREIIFDSAAFLGTLRFLSLSRNWNLKFNGMNYTFESRSSFYLNKNTMIRHILSRSENSTNIKDVDLLEDAESLLRSIHCKRKYCSGHDCIRVLAHGLARAIGNSNKFDSETGAQDLEKILRLSYSLDDFMKTNLFESIRAWQMRSGFRVLRT